MVARSRLSPPKYPYLRPWIEPVNEWRQREVVKGETTSKDFSFSSLDSATIYGFRFVYDFRIPSVRTKLQTI